MCFFFFKQKTAYEMRISDWSSDVCSSDLLRYSYRHSELPEGAIVVAARFKGQPGDAHAIQAEMDRISASREASQPLRSKTGRSEERRVGKECVSTCRSRWSPDH